MNDNFFLPMSDAVIPKLRLMDGFPILFYYAGTGGNNCNDLVDSMLDNGIPFMGPYGGGAAACQAAILGSGRMKVIQSIGTGDILSIATEDELRAELKKQMTAVLSTPEMSIATSVWYLNPEEIKPWRAGNLGTGEWGELTYLKAACRLIRDIEKEMGLVSRPIMGYQPGNRSETELSEFNNTYDVIIRSGYYGYNDLDLRVNTVTSAVDAAYAGSNKAQGFLPMLGLSLASDPPVTLSDNDLKAIVRNDVYLSIARGGKGIAVWSWFARAGLTPAVRDKIVALYQSLSRELNVTHPEFGLAIARGEMGRSDAIQSILKNGLASNLVTQDFYDSSLRYFLAVNTSSTESISADIQGWPDGSTIIELRDDIAPGVKTKLIEFTLAPLQVQIWKIIAELKFSVNLPSTIKSGNNLVVAWVGGLPPYSVTTEISDSGIIDKVGQLSTNYTFDTTGTPTGKYLITITDAVGDVISSNECTVF